MKKNHKLKTFPNAPNRWKMFHRLVILLFLFAAVRAEDADVSYIIYIINFFSSKIITHECHDYCIERPKWGVERGVGAQDFIYNYGYMV